MKSMGQHFYTRGISLCSYNGIMRESIYRFKYGGRKEYAKAYGRLMGHRFGAMLKRAGVEGIVPVPLHPKREYQRGYNQAALLAEALGRETGIRVYQDYILRTRYTQPMKTLSAPERQNNLKKAFKIGRDDVKLKVIIVIDDIYTTGSTIDAVAKVLIEAGALRVYFMTLAIGEDI
jgi:ComF family protein